MFKTFKSFLGRSTMKASTTLLLATVALIGVVVAGLQFGVFQEYVPNDPMLLITVGFIVVLFTYALLKTVLLNARKVDRERHAFGLVQDLMNRADLSAANKVKTLLSGELFTGALAATRVAEFFSLLAAAKAANPNRVIDMERHIAMLGDDLQESLSGIAAAANTQPKLGFLGTLIGLVVSLHNFDITGAQASAGAAGNVLGQMMVGIGVAVLTSVVGLIGNIILDKFHAYLSGEVVALVSAMEKIAETVVSPVLNADATPQRQNPSNGGGSNAAPTQ